MVGRATRAGSRVVTQLLLPLCETGKRATARKQPNYVISNSDEYGQVTQSRLFLFPDDASLNSAITATPVAPRVPTTLHPRIPTHAGRGDPGWHLLVIPAAAPNP